MSKETAKCNGQPASERSCPDPSGSPDGHKAYEQDVKARPFYHDGSPRKTWDQLGKLEQSTWSK